jgi:hypothetical protein
MGWLFVEHATILDLVVSGRLARLGGVGDRELVKSNRPCKTGVD